MARCLPLAIAVGTLGLSGCAGLQTEIGLPTAYWGAGFWTFTGYAAVLMLLGFLALGLLAGQAGILWPSFAGLLVLIQFLPAPESGLLIVPAAPWSYWGSAWAVCCTVGALACWLGLLVALCCSLTSCGYGSTCFLVLTLLGANGLAWFDAAVSSPRPQRFATPVSSARACALPVSPQEPALLVSDRAVADVAARLAEYREQITRWNSARERASAVLAQLEADRQALTGRIESLDENSGSDERAGAGRLAEIRREWDAERQELDRLIASVAGDVALLETATQRTESRLRRIERRRLVSESGLVDAEEFEELSRIERELEDGLRATR